MNFTTELSPRIASTPQPLGFNQHEFPSKRIVPIDWHKLASVDLHDLNSGCCTVEMLQEQLNHIAFCQPEKEIHMENAVGQRNMLKMFRLAQMIVQYLFISQEYMEKQLNQSKREHQLMLEKYNEMKEKLKEQIEEAKKMKKSNKNMSESITYLNSLLSSVGALEHYRCPFCPKAFRNQEFLRSHLQRKHPLQAESVNISNCFVQNVYKNAVNKNMDPNTQNLPVYSTLQSRRFSHAVVDRPRNDTHITEKANLSHVNLSPNYNPYPLDQPSTSKTQSHSVFFIDTNNSNMVEGFPSSLNRSQKEADSDLGNVTQTLRAKTPNEKGKSNDIDMYKLHEMQKNFNIMNDMVFKLSKDLENQKQMMERENDTRSKELKIHLDEKHEMKESYESIIQKLTEKIEILQAKTNESSGEDHKLKVINLIDKQQLEINNLKENFKDKTQQNTQNSTEKRDEKLKKEVQKLGHDLKLIEEKHANDITNLRNNFQKEYENALIKEKQEHERQIANLRQLNSEMLLTATKPPVLSTKKTVKKPVPKRNAKPILKRNFTNENKMIQSETESSDSETDTSRWYQTDKNFNKDDNVEETEEEEENEEKEERKQDSDQSSSETEDYKPPTNYPKPINCVEKQNERGNKRRIYSSENESTSEEESLSDYENTDNRLDLKELTRRNPGLWNQMRDVIEEELSRRLMQFNITEEERGVSSKDLKSHLFHLIKMRKTLRDKYEDFNSLRKSIENKIDSKIQNQMSNELKKKDTLREPKKLKDHDSSSAKAFKEGFKRLASKVKLKTKAFQRSLKLNDNPNVQNESITGEENEDSTDDEDADNSEKLNTSGDEELSNKTQVEIHNETAHSVRRNLFSGSPITSSPHYPRRQSFFENETYKISEEEWDSKSSDPSSANHEYENLKADPPRRSDSLSPKSDSPKPGTSKLLQNNDENKDIKLRKPTGQMVMELSKKIENQLKMRSQQKPPGAIDIMGKGEKADNLSDDIKEIESILTESE